MSGASALRASGVARVRQDGGPLALTVRSTFDDGLIGPACKERDLVVAMACSQVISPSSEPTLREGLRYDTPPGWARFVR